MPLAMPQINNQYKAVISDFGLTKAREAAKLETRCGSPAWSAPEVMRGESYTELADVYSFGIVLWEVLTRRPPYEGIDASVLIGRGELRAAYLLLPVVAS